MKMEPPRPTVLIFGGTAEAQDRAGQALAGAFDPLIAPSPAYLDTLMAENFVQVVVALGPDDGTDSLTRWPETMRVVVSERAVAPDPQVLSLPPSFSAPDLIRAVTTASDIFQLRRENARLALEMRCLKTKAPAAPDSALGFGAVLHAPGSAMARVVTKARQFASFDVPVLLVGEPGTGKGQLARAIHDTSLRSDGPFQTLDLTGLSEDTIAAALFGHRKPANGAPGVNRPGLVRKAEQGTLLLAGVETLSHPMQMRLLRLVRDGLFEAEGAREAERTRVRVISATSRDPQQLMAQGAFSTALYYALSIAELALPPLRDRAEDVPLLAQRALEDAIRIHGKSAKGFSEAALDFFLRYGWPGNLSELRNEVTRMLVRAQEPVLGPDVISRRILQAAPRADAPAEAEIMIATGPLKDRVEAIEARILRETLTRLRWNKSRSAAELGLSRVGLRAKLERYGITQPAKAPATAPQETPQTEEV